MKFFMILISLLIVSFGIICLAVISDNNGVKQIKENLEYNYKSEEYKSKVDNYINKIEGGLFIVVILGVCLFIASLFL